MRDAESYATLVPPITFICSSAIGAGAEGAPHGLFLTHMDRVNAELFDVIYGGY